MAGGTVMFCEYEDIARTLARWYRDGVINRRTFVYLWNREVFQPAAYWKRWEAEA